jgi:G:T-mismatch repair DNA endonuclease (very short patch repair protein)
MKCSICHEEGHRSDNRKFHPKNPLAPSLVISDADSTPSTATPPQPVSNTQIAQQDQVNTTQICIPVPETSFTTAAQKFIEKAKVIHNGEQYDYSYVKYINGDTLVSIWCKKTGHGIFEKVPYNHIKHKSGCPKCFREKKRFDESVQKLADFIAKATAVHNNEYDYSSVNSSTAAAKEKVLIGCKQGHPAFPQLPSSHLSGAGCPLCAHKKIADSKRKSHNEFIKESIKKHGDIYDYSETVYNGSAERITIICKCEGHRPFECVATLHLQGQGCPICAKEQVALQQRLTLEEFIMRSIASHGSNAYDYRRSEYTGFHNQITIYCKKHEEFFTQTAGSHMSGKGCYKCGLERRNKSQTFTREEFIAQAIVTHGDTYDYADANYVNSQTKITIKCKKHGAFTQVPNSHLCGFGCKHCAIEKNADRCRLERSKFIERAVETHGNKYDYSDVVYISMAINIKINCLTCGKSFKQLPGNHVVKGFGCPNCAGNAILTTEEFIEKSKKIHGENAYNYSQCVYVRSNQNVTIVCNKTELPFKQTPNSHLNGSNCPCCKPKYSKPHMQYVAFRSVSSPTLQHALNGGEHRIRDSRYSADGYIPENTLVLEFHGCLWHGCPKCFNPSARNPFTKRTFSEEYERTRMRQGFIESKGYMYTEVWECEWRTAIKAVVKLQMYWRKKCDN